MAEVVGDHEAEVVATVGEIRNHRNRIMKKMVMIRKKGVTEATNTREEEVERVLTKETSSVIPVVSMGIIPLNVGKTNLLRRIKVMA